MIDFSNYFSVEELGLIRSKSIESEEKARFSEEIIQLIHTKKWLRVAMPSFNDGNPLNAYEIALLFEALAYADGSLGWAINLGAGANMFLGYLTKTTATELNNNPKLWLAGSGAPTGKAIKSDGGYVLSGQWKYASGSLYATHFTANAYLYDEKEQPILNEKNQPVFRSFLFPAEEVSIIDTWQTIGLKASCSNDYKVNECYIANDYVFDLTEQSNYSNYALYRYSFDAFAIANITVMCTGMALHFIELFNRDIKTKKPLYGTSKVGDMPQVTELYSILTENFYRSRSDFFQALQLLWDAVENNSKKILELERRLEQEAKKLADTSYELVVGLYRYCGMNPVFTNSEISKVVRDFLVATQHYIISPLQFV